MECCVTRGSRIEATAPRSHIKLHGKIKEAVTRWQQGKERDGNGGNNVRWQANHDVESVSGEGPTGNTLIRTHASGPDPRLALFLFSGLLRHSPQSLDKFPSPFAIEAAAELSALRDGTALHGMIAKSPLFRSDIFI
ncbi:Pentatricopeptide repeat-containing protein [Canna indica]|uniref:Pentatricopeptide repeat-containing protein n=1 Tax=Canna indica TaxID=4628 RepID=A0AAQ3KBB4_9LILI|nr:Pentatricopeptide repeat-containing protein [Canna indica]